MVSTQTYQIKQMDGHLLEWLAHKQIGEPIGKVHSVFEKVVNFITYDRTLLFSLAKSDVIQSPRMMKACENKGFSDMCSTLEPGNLVCLIGNKRLKINNWQWDFSNASVWTGDINNPKQSRPEIAFSQLTFINNFIHKNGARGGIFSAWKSFNHPSWEVPKEARKDIYFSHFLTGLDILEQEIKEKRLANFTDKFVGLGIGLTPSGDDFLTGLLATWQYFTFPLYKEFKAHQIKWLQKLNGRTTDVSYFMLKHCIEGEVNEAMLRLLENLDGNPVSHLQEVLSIGSTSGTDMLIGLSFAYQQLVNHKEEK